MINRPNRHALGVLSGLVLVGLAAASGLGRIQSYDAFWHLATFRDWWQQGLSPFVDHFTYTHAGQPIAAQPLPFQGLIYLLEQSFGVVTGFTVYRSGMLALTVALFLAGARRRLGISWPLAAAAGLLLVAALQARALVRPELMVYPVAVWLALWSVRHRHGLTPAGTVEAGVLLVLANLVHQSSVLCFAIAGAAVLSAWLGAWRRGDWAQFRLCTVAGLAFAALSFASPFGPNPVLETLVLTGQDYGRLIAEYERPDRIEFLVPATVLLLSLACGLRWLRAGWLTPILLALVLGWQSWLSVRAGPFLAIALLPWLAMQGEAVVTSLGKGRRAAATAVLVGLAAVVAWLNPFNGIGQGIADGLSPARFPVGLKDALSSARGNLFARFEHGGYLAYAHPEVRTYIDGRSAILFSPEFVAAASAAPQDPQWWTLATSQPEPAAWILAAARDQELVTAALASGWQLADADAHFVLFARDGPFPATTALLAAPECAFRWPRSRLIAERERWQARDAGRVAHSPASPSVGFALVSAVIRARDGAAPADAPWQPAVVERSLARLRAARGELGGVQFHLSRIPPGELRASDPVLLALAQVRAGDLASARTNLSWLLQGGTIPPARIDALLSSWDDPAAVERGLLELLSWHDACSVGAVPGPGQMR